MALEMLLFQPRFRPVLRAVSCLGGGLLGPTRVTMPSYLSQAMALSSAKKPVDDGEEKRIKPEYIAPVIVKKKWSPDEDTLLRAGIEKHGFKWTLISTKLLPERSAPSCWQRWMTVLNPELKTGPWSTEEDAQLTKMVGEVDDWPEIVRRMGGRSYLDCHNRWTTMIDPSLKKGNWSAGEDAVILAGVAELGRKWSIIGERLPGRCALDIAQRYKTLAKEKVKWSQWSDEEDKVLKTAVEKHGTRDWGIIAGEVEGKNASTCIERWRRLGRNKRTGSSEWNGKEDALLAAGVQQHGSKDKWAAIAATIPGKTGRECRVRWERHVSRVLNKTPWTNEEDAIIVKMRGNGLPCDKFFHHLPGRDKDAIRMRCKELGHEIIDNYWTAAEVEALKKALHLYEGKRRDWSKIVQQVPGKTVRQCKNVLRTVKL